MPSDLGPGKFQVVKRVLALDYGMKRIGIAVSDPGAIISQSSGFLYHDPEDRWIEEIEDMIQRQGIGSVVLGLPLNMDGSDSPLCRTVKQLAETLKDRLRIPVCLWDERLTTRQAEKLLISGNVRRKKRKIHVDGVAAALLLQSYLEYHSPHQ